MIRNAASAWRNERRYAAQSEGGRRPLLLLGGDSLRRRARTCCNRRGATLSSTSCLARSRAPAVVACSSLVQPQLGPTPEQPVPHTPYQAHHRQLLAVDP